MFQEKDNQHNSVLEAETSVACWRDGMIKGETVGDKVRESEPDRAGWIRTLDFILSKL